MMMAASCPKPDSEGLVHSLAAFDENKQQALEYFYFLSKSLLKARTVISPLPIHDPGRQLCSFSIFSKS